MHTIEYEKELTATSASVLLTDADAPPLEQKMHLVSVLTGVEPTGATSCETYMWVAQGKMFARCVAEFREGEDAMLFKLRLPS